MWNHIVNQRDLEYLMKEYSGFHNSILLEMNYVRSAISKDKKIEASSPMSSKGNATLSFYNEESKLKCLQMEFMDVKEISIKQKGDELIGYILGATILMETDYFVWFDSDNFEDDYELLYQYEDVSWIKAKNIRWREMIS